MKLVIVLLLWAFAAIASEKNTIQLHQHDTSLRLGKYFEVLIDKTNSLTIEDVSSSSYDSKFVKENVDNKSYGFNESSFWLRFTARKADVSVASDWLLELSYPHIDHVDLYVPSEGGTYSVKKTGDSCPYIKRDYRDTNFIFDLQVRDVPTTYYVHIYGHCSKQFPFTLWNKRKFFEHVFNVKLLFGIYYGILLAMALINFFVFFIVKDRSYLYYVLYIIGMVFAQTSYNGFAFKYLWPDSIWWHSKSMPFFIGSTGFFMSLFAMHFMYTKRYFPALHKMLLGVMLLNALQAVFSLIIPYLYSIQLAMLLMVTMAILLFVTGVCSAYSGFRPGKFFLLAWSFFLVGMILIPFKTMGLLPNVFITEYGMQVGSAIEVLLLSLALADRIRLLETRRNEASKMAALGRMATSIVHDLKSPITVMYGHAEFARKNMDLDAKKTLAEIILEQVEKINRMIVEILDYSKDVLILEIQKIDATRYLSDISQNLKPFLDSLGISLKLDIKEQEHVEIDQNRFSRVIYNVINNSVDALNGSDTENKKITIQFSKDENRSVFKISDNGPGIPEDFKTQIFQPFSTKGKVHGTGLGMSNSKKIVEAHGGTIMFKDNSDTTGTTFIIEIPVPSK